MKIIRTPAKRILSVILIVTMIITLVLLVSASDNSQTLIDDEVFVIDKRQSFIINLKDDAECKLYFSACDNSRLRLNSELVENDEVKYKIIITDSNSRKVFSRDLSGRIRNQRFFLSDISSFILKKGKYELSFEADKKYNTSECDCTFDVTYKATSIVLAQGEKEQLTAYSAIKGKKIPWGNFDTLYSSNEQVATVSWNGIVTAQGLGKAIIKGEYYDNDTYDDEKFQVSIIVNSIDMSLFLGESKSLKYLIKNVGDISTARWSSNNKSVVSVTKRGKATVNDFGKATLKVKIDGQIYKVNVTVPKIKLNKTSVSLIVGKSVTLTLSASNEKTTWHSSNTKVATVSGNGKVTAKQPGSATVTATYAGKNYSCKINVKKATYGSVSGTVVANYKKYGQYDFYPDTGARVFVIDPSDNSVLGKAMVNGDGSYTIPNVLAGKWVILFISNHVDRYNEDKITVYGFTTRRQHWSEKIVVKANQTTVSDAEFYA